MAVLQYLSRRCNVETSFPMADTVLAKLHYSPLLRISIHHLRLIAVDASFPGGMLWSLPDSVGQGAKDLVTTNLLLKSNEG